MVGGAGDRGRVGGAAEGVDQLVVDELARSLDVHAAGLGVEGGGATPDEPDAGAVQEGGDVVVREFLARGDLVLMVTLLLGRISRGQTSRAERDNPAL
ncbi:hypothetical protein ACFC06_28705 [Nocardia sp. NPDC056064]|uniref:hypothetical protein n=1 Tax=Nocardia sp. NPDC056064 TaxID=3345701 RepID=UPI0035DF77C6